MILARLRALRDTRIAELERRMSDESFMSARLGGDVDRLAKDNADLRTQLRAEQAEVRRLSVGQTVTSAAACECGGDTELHLRKRAVDAELSALRDRANARVMADRLAQAEGRPVVGSPA